MKVQSGWIRGSLMLAVLVGLVAAPEALGGGKPRGGGARRAPRMTAPHRASRAPQQHRAPQMSRAKAPSKTKVPSTTGNAQVHTRNVQPNVNNNPARVAHANTTNANRVPGAPANSTVNRSTNVGTTSLTGTPPNHYLYGSGNTTRRYQAYGYGRGYRNRYSGGYSGYGQSQGNNRAIVSRLRSVHSSLARIDHDYQGHRARAQHHVSMAIRQLSHRSGIYSGSGFSAGANNVRTAGLDNQGARNGQNNGRMRLSQAQSDARMSQALRTTQGIAMQMSNQGTNSSGHARARGHLQYAVREMGTALSVR